MSWPGKNRIARGLSVSVSPPTATAFLPTLRASIAAIDSMFRVCSYALAMQNIRVDDHALTLHLEVALATAAPSLLDGLGDSDRWRRQLAIGEIARQLVERLKCFDISSVDAGMRAEPQPSLFPQDLGPIG